MIAINSINGFTCSTPFMIDLYQHAQSLSYLQYKIYIAGLIVIYQMMAICDKNFAITSKKFELGCIVTPRY